MKDFEVIESKVWRNAKTGQEVSMYGAPPFMEEGYVYLWNLESRGWTIRDNRNNTVGCGRPPFKDKAEAEALADKWNREAEARRVREYNEQYENTPVMAGHSTEDAQ